MANPDAKEHRCIAVDFDCTLATYDEWKGADVVGEPIPEMVAKVKAELAAGVPVIIFTARVNPGEANNTDADDATKSYLAIAEWSRKVFGKVLPITHEKSRHFTEIWDDRAREVFKNTGEFAVDVLSKHLSENQ